MKKHVIVLSSVLISTVLFITFLYTNQSKEKPINKGYVEESSNPRILSVSSAVDPNATPPPVKQKPLNSAEAETALKEYILNKQGTYSFYIKNLSSQHETSLNENLEYYAASLYKVPLAITVLDKIENSEITLDQQVELLPEHIEEGSGTIQNETVGAKFSVETLLSRLLKESDNVAQNMLFSIVPEIEIAKIYSAEISRGEFPHQNIGTPKEIAKVFEDLYNQKYLDKNNTDLIISTMVNTSFDDRVHLGISPDVSFAHKIGNWPEEGSWHDCGVIFNDKAAVICIMSKDTSFEDFADVATKIGSYVEEYVL